MYFLVSNCKLSFQEAWDMPVEVRHWWIEKKQTEIEKSNEKVGAKQHTDPFGKKHG